MKNLFLYGLPLLCVSLLSSFSFGQYMINGGFEQWDDDDDNDGNPDDYWNYSLEYAVEWHNLVNTCDVNHSLAPFVAGSPHSGVGFARFVAPENSGLNEYCYGKTLPLTAGNTYVVSFWVRKDFSSDRDVPVGCIISPTIPTITTGPFTSSHTPQITITPTSTQYVQASFCFTPQTSGTHYVTFGPWVAFGGSEVVGILLDDVKVDDLPQGSALPVANLSIPQNSYCEGASITVDGSSTTDETGYVWEIYRLVNSSGEQLLYTSGQQNGQAGTFDVTAQITPEVGECYRVYLKATGACQDETSVDFCIVDPDFEFIHDGEPVCEGEQVDLEVTGENTWTYSWYTGTNTNGTPFLSGVGLDAATVFPAVGNASYTVKVTTPEGCTHTETYTFTVHSQNNIAPWMNGINGSGDYTIYVNQGNTVSFTSNLYNDNNNEVMLVSQTNTIPSSFSYTLPTTSGGVMSFSWATNSSTPLGTHTFKVIANDQNSCHPETGEFTFNIIVVCDYCPICLTYNDRLPNDNPLPGETRTADCIKAGVSGPVETGTASVLFQAGNTIELGNDFTGGPGFEGIVNAGTCVSDCEWCCDDFEGFTVDLPIPNVFTPNGDGVNDYWFVADEDHPFCAFGAQGFSLFIMNQWGNIVHKAEEYGGCCSFQAPSPSNPINYSSVNWDGNNLSGVPVTENAYYFYIVTFFGCGQEVTYDGNIYLIRGGKKNAEPFPVDEESGTEEIEMSISPNPTRDIVNFNGLGDKTWSMVLIDSRGNKVLTDELDSNRQQIDVSILPPATYHVILSSGEDVFFDKLMVVK